MDVGRVALGLIRQSTVGGVEELRAVSATSSLAKILLDGLFPDVLQDPVVSSMLASEEELAAASIRSASDFYEALSVRIHTCAHQALARGDYGLLETLLAAGASCLNVFVQHNLTGPNKPEDPSPLQLLAPYLESFPAASVPVTPTVREASAASAASPFHASSPLVSEPCSHAPGGSSRTAGGAADGADDGLAPPHERWAAEQLALDGEDLVTHKISHLQYLLLSEAVLVGPLLATALAANPGDREASTPAQGDVAAPCGTGGAPASPEAGVAGAAAAVHVRGRSACSRMPQGPISPEVCEVMCGRAGFVGGSWLWWALRATCMHQHVLAGRSATLLARTNALTKQLLASITAPCPPQPMLPAAPAAGWPKDLTKAAAAATAAVASSKAGQAAVPAAAKQGSVVCAWLPTLQTHPALHACVLLEMALGQYSYGFVEQGQKLLNEAGTVLGLHVGLSGALGRRTVYQEDPKAQLVVRATRARRQPPLDLDPDVTSFGFEPIQQPRATGEVGSGARPSPGSGGAEAKAQAKQPTHGMVDESDVYIAPKLVSEDGQVLEPRYSATEQALLLAWATHVKKGSAQDELQLWEMAPYLEAVLSQPRSHMMLQATARLLKARHERTRNRTRERALLHMEQLLEALAAHAPPLGPEPGAGTQQPQAASSDAGRGMQQQQQQQASQPARSGACPPAAGQADAMDRNSSCSGPQVLQARTSGSGSPTGSTHLPYAYGCRFPLRVHLRKELAEHYMSMGFVGAALGIYEDLQLWDALVVCYRLLDKRGAAEDLLKRRLKVTPDDPVIWCNLGDLYTDDSYYEEAWRRSGCRHARSKRSLGRCALRRKDYAAAATHFKEALAINPLNPDAWFSQGYAYLKLGEQRKALRALTHVTQQVPDHAEAWNNVAALWLELGEPKRAYSALGECLRYKRDSWQIWENYAQVAQQAGFPMQATRALAQVLQLSSGTRLLMPVLQQLVQTVEDTLKKEGSIAPDSAGHQGDAPASAGASEAEGEEDDLAGFVLDIPISLGLLPWAGSGTCQEGNEGEGADAALSYPTRSAYQTGIEAAQQRTEEQMCTAVGKVLKEAVNLPCCNPEVWGLLGRYYSLCGQLEGAKEALLKQVRALSGSAAFKSDEARFVEVADASIALAQTYLQLFRSSTANAITSPPPLPQAAHSCGGCNGNSVCGGSSNRESSRQEAPVLSVGSATMSTAATAAAAATIPLLLQPGSIRELAAARMHLRGLLKQCQPAFEGHAKWQALSVACAEITAIETEAKSVAAISAR